MSSTPYRRRVTADLEHITRMVELALEHGADLVAYRRIVTEADRFIAALRTSELNGGMYRTAIIDLPTGEVYGFEAVLTDDESRALYAATMDDVGAALERRQAAELSR